MKTTEQWQKEAEGAYRAASYIQATLATASLTKKRMTLDETFNLLGCAMRVTAFFDALPEWHLQMRSK